MSRPVTLFPVILPVIEDISKLPGREKVALLSRVSREALQLSAEKSGVTIGELHKDEDDVPLPSGNYYWSVSHKPKYVAAVISNDKVGIDIEEIQPRSESLFDYVASDGEWELSQGKSWDTLFRYWTAKEATLKSIGVGICGLKTCRIISVSDGDYVILDYQNHIFKVAQLRYKGHIVSILRDNNQIEWIIPEDCQRSGDRTEGFHENSPF
jgi:4'-phosphopantetheinyl transferase